MALRFAEDAASLVDFQHLEAQGTVDEVHLHVLTGWMEEFVPNKRAQ